MATTPDKLTLLIRPGETLSHSRGLPMMQRVSDPGPSFPRLRRFFRPWRFIGKLLAIGLPCWLFSATVAVGAWFAGALTRFFEGLLPLVSASVDTATVLALLPLGILALWAGVLGLRDLAELGRHRKRADAYADALARLGDEDILTPADLRSPGIREGLVTLGHFEKLLATIDRDADRMSSLLRDAMHESNRLVLKSVLDLIATERRLEEWSGRLGNESSYMAKLIARRERLAGSYAGILDQCLHATDQALARAEDHTDDLDQSVTRLLDSCQRALVEVERDGPAIDEEELLMYAAKAREAQARGEAADTDRPDLERPKN